MTIYKLSIVVPGRRDIGGIQNTDKEPRVGDTVILGPDKYEIIDIVELMPPRGDFVYLHTVCRPLLQKDSGI